MNIIYNQLIKLYGFVVKVAASFNPKAKLWIEGRKDWQSKLREKVGPNDRVIWVHCSSLGEFEQGRPVMERIRQQYPLHKLVISFFLHLVMKLEKTTKNRIIFFIYHWILRAMQRN